MASHGYELRSRPPDGSQDLHQGGNQSSAVLVVPQPQNPSPVFEQPAQAVANPATPLTPQGALLPSTSPTVPDVSTVIANVTAGTPHMPSSAKVFIDTAAQRYLPAPTILVVVTGAQTKQVTPPITVAAPVVGPAVTSKAARAVPQQLDVNLPRIRACSKKTVAQQLNQFPLI